MIRATSENGRSASTRRATNAEEPAFLSLRDLQIQYDCGLKCCTDIPCRSLQKYAKLGYFVVVYCVALCVHSSAQAYFTHNAVINNEYKLPPTDVDAEWLTLWYYGVTVVLAAPVAYIGAVSHPPSWMAAFSFLHGVSCLVLPTLTFFIVQRGYSLADFLNLSTFSSSLCKLQSEKPPSSEQHWIWSWPLIFNLFAIQTFSSIANVCLLALGILYADRNCSRRNMPIVLGLVVASRYLGLKALHLLIPLKVLINSYINIDVIWYGHGFMMMGCAIILALFPRQFMKDRILHSDELTASRRPTLHRLQQYSEKTGFFAGIRRIFGNKTLLFLMLATLCLNTLMWNSFLFEESYVKSIFYIGNPLSFLLIPYVLRYPVVFICAVLCGFCISAIRPRASWLISFNMLCVSIVIVLSFANIFLRCNEFTLPKEDKLVNGNKQCNCMDYKDFEPICSQDGRTVYYSPCIAGCHTVALDQVTMTRTYNNCTNAPQQSVSEALCKNEACRTKATIFQFVLIAGSSLLALVMVGNALLLIRIVNERDRALVIAAQLVLSSIVAYIPEKYLYSLISNATCTLKTAQSCKINKANQFSTYINMSNICILIAAIGFYGIVWYKNRRINLFSDARSGSEGIGTNGSRANSLTRGERPKQSSLRLPGKSNMVYKNNYNRLNSNETDSFLRCDTNPFAKDVLKELSNLQNINARNGIDTDLEQTMRATSGVTLRRDGVLTTLL